MPCDAGDHCGVIAAEREGREIDTEPLLFLEFSPEVCIGGNASAHDDGLDTGVVYGPVEALKKNVYRSLAEARRDILGGRFCTRALVGRQMVDHCGFQTRVRDVVAVLALMERG